MLAFAAKSKGGKALKALPKDQLDIDRLPRQYVANVIYYVCGDEFDKWISKTIEARNKKITEERDLLIEMDPEVARVFQASTSVSSKWHSFRHALPNLFCFLYDIAQKGVSAHLLKPSAKRRRTKQQIQTDKLRAAK